MTGPKFSFSVAEDTEEPIAKLKGWGRAVITRGLSQVQLAWYTSFHAKRLDVRGELQEAF